MFFDLIRPYIALAKLWIGILIIGAIAGYVGWLHWTISAHEEQIQTLQGTVRQCEDDRFRLNVANKELFRTMDVWEAYYGERGCLDLNDETLKPDEMKIRVK